MTIKTGSTYDSMRYIITIPTANLLPGRVCKKYQQVTVTSITTGNSDMTDKTGNSYGTTTNSVEITTACQVFMTTKSSNKVPLSDCDNARQPEMKTQTCRARACNFWSTFVEIIWLHFYRARHHRKSRICRWNFDAICQCHSSRDISISGSGRHL